jgi:hypothetical protein
LVDYGVDFDENSRNYLRSLFAYNARSFANINAFLIKRPKIDTPEIFDGYAFSPIPQENNGLYNKPIALLNMASYEALNAYYGAIAQYFHPSHLEIYSALAKYYTVVRVLVEDPCHLPRILEVVKTSLQLACTYWALNGHGNDHALQLGFGQLLMISDEDLMREIAKLIECGGIVSLWGCSNAMKTINLVRTFSENAQDRLVEGSTDGVIGVTCREIWAPGSGRVSVPLTFFHTPGHFQTKTYLNGEVIAEGHTGWQSHL